MAVLFPASLVCTINRPLDDKTVKLNITERDQIPIAHRYRGMQVLVQNTGALKPQLFWLPTDNLNMWEEISIGSAIFYLHKQTTLSDTWSIQHNLGRFPVTVLCIDSNGDEILGQKDLAASNNNLMVIKFSEPLIGTAYAGF